MINRRLLLVTLALVAGLGALSGPELRAVVLGLALLIVPGYLLDRLIAAPLPNLPLVRPLVWVGLSLSSIVVLYLGASLVRVPLTSPLLLGLLLAASGLALWLAWRLPLAPSQPLPEPAALAALALVLGATAVTRYLHAADLHLPAWVDSVHHALLIRIVTETGLAPWSLQPYLPVEQVAYHWGYHVLVATVVQLSGADLPAVMLWGGQLLGVVVVLAVAVAASVLWQSLRVAPWAALVAGLISIMPAYYLSWGRYTLLTAFVIVPVALLVTLAMARLPSWRLAVLAVVLFVGASLVHIASALMACLWCLALWLVYQRHWQRLTFQFAVVALLMLAILSPWFLILAGQAQPGSGSSPTYVAGNQNYNAMPTVLLWNGANALLFAVALLATWLGCYQKRSPAPLLLIWLLLLVLLANPPLLRLPYLSFFTNEILVISLFLPLALAISGGVLLFEAALVERLPRATTYIGIVGLVLVCGLALGLAIRFQRVVNPTTVLVTADDLAALRWAQSGLPRDARVVVNTAGWLDDVDRGADGGWWLLPLAGVQVSTPPVVFNYGAPDYVQAVKRQTAWLRQVTDLTPAQLAEFMRREGYTHAYATSAGPALKDEQLRGAPEFVELFRQGRVTIYQLAP